MKIIKKTIFSICSIASIVVLTSCDLRGILKDFIDKVDETKESYLTSSAQSASNPNFSSSQKHKGVEEDIIYDDFQIHFMMLGNDKAGDSIYIKAGDTDVLIDAGSRKNSSQTTLPYMDEYVKDKKTRICYYDTWRPRPY